LKAIKNLPFPKIGQMAKNRPKAPPSLPRTDHLEFACNYSICSLYVPVGWRYGLIALCGMIGLSGWVRNQNSGVSGAKFVSSSTQNWEAQKNRSARKATKDTK
jgi:hypothetical protein